MPGISFGTERILPLRMPRIAVGIDCSSALSAPRGGLSLPLMPGAKDSWSSSDSSSVPFDSMIFTNAASWRWPLLTSSIPSSPAARRRRMIWSIGATPFGQASMHEKQWVQS